jgi:hypothetical protein
MIVLFYLGFFALLYSAPFLLLGALVATSFARTRELGIRCLRLGALGSAIGCVIGALMLALFRAYDVGMLPFIYGAGVGYTTGTGFAVQMANRQALSS